MNGSVQGLSEVLGRTFPFPRRHFLSVLDLNPVDVAGLLDLAEGFVELNRQTSKKLDLLKGRTLINLFFENSTRTQSSFELAAKRLGADTINMSPRSSSIAKGETLIDTAVTLNAMRPDILVVRHGASGAASLLAQKVSCSVTPCPCDGPLDTSLASGSRSVATSCTRAWPARTSASCR